MRRTNSQTYRNRGIVRIEFEDGMVITGRVNEFERRDHVIGHETPYGQVHRVQATGSTVEVQILDPQVDFRTPETTLPSPVAPPAPEPEDPNWGTWS